jgi:hypothetical protein
LELPFAAQHSASVPPFDPEQIQAKNIPAMLTTFGLLLSPQRAEVGDEDAVDPFDRPHTPLTPLRAAVHCAAVPPFDPAQVHVQGPLPLTAGVLPSPHRFVFGAEDIDVPPAEPQAPLPVLNEHCAAVPSDPVHVQTVLPLAVAAVEAVPTWQVPELEPHTAVIIVVEHDALVPPFDPAQVQDHGPVPPTAGVLPSAHRFDVGAEDTDV